MRLTGSSILTLSLCGLLLGNQLLIALPSFAITDAELLGRTTATVVEQPAPTETTPEKPAPYQPTAEDYFNGTNGVVQDYAKACESVISSIQKGESSWNRLDFYTSQWVVKFEQHPELAVYTEKLLIALADKFNYCKPQFALADFYQSRHPLHNEQKSLAILEKMLFLRDDHDTDKQSEITAKIGHWYEIQGNYPQALQYYETALKLRHHHDREEAKEGLGKLYLLGAVFK